MPERPFLPNDSKTVEYRSVARQDHRTGSSNKNHDILIYCCKMLNIVECAAYLKYPLTIWSYAPSMPNQLLINPNMGGERFFSTVFFYFYWPMNDKR